MADQRFESGPPEILARTRNAKPAAYAAAVKKNKGNGSAHPDGFTVNLEPAQDGENVSVVPTTI